MLMQKYQQMDQVIFLASLLKFSHLNNITQNIIIIKHNYLNIKIKTLLNKRLRNHNLYITFRNIILYCTHILQ